jgi:hypothetical protein
MKQRTLKVVADVMGMQTSIAVLKIQAFATEPELRQWTELVCPKCSNKPSYRKAVYECECGQSYSWWGKLKRVLKGTVTEVLMPRLLGSGETAVAKMFKMDIATFSKYVDATKTEKGVTVKDEATATNLFKLIVATEKLGKVLIIRYNDTTEEVVALLTQSVSGRIIFKEIIPINLLQLKETLKMDMSAITQKDIEEAKGFLNIIPEATEQTLMVSDFRVGALNVTAVSEEKVVELKAILAKAK